MRRPLLRLSAAVLAAATLSACAVVYSLAPAGHGPPDYYGSVVVTELVSVYDGDTFTVNIKEWPPIAGEKISVRILHIDTPEMKDPRPEVRELAVRAKEYVESRLRSARKVELRGMRRDKYFRILAEPYVDGERLTDGMIKEGLAKPYEGGTKEEW